MEALALLAVAFVGTLFWVANPEAAVVLYASQGRLSPVLIGLTVAVGQAAALSLLFRGGGWLALRWPWFGRQCARVRARLGDKVGGGRAMAVLVTSGLLGFPPASATVVVAPGLGLSAARVLPLLFALRLARFTLLAAIVGGFLQALIDRLRL